MNYGKRAFRLCGVILLILFISLFQTSVACASGYAGQRGAISIKPTGCNAVAIAPVPGSNDLFIGRQFFKSDGSPLTQKEGCDKDVEAVKSARWGLVLSRLDWGMKELSVVKPLLVPPLRVTGGSIEGAIISRAYDADIVEYHNQDIIVFECSLANGKDYAVVGSSSCLALFDRRRQEIQLDTINVIIRGQYGGKGKSRLYYSASVPKLLVWDDKLYLYYSVITIERGRFIRVAVRGAELEIGSSGAYRVKGAMHVVQAIESPTIEVWGPAPGNPLTDTAVDIMSAWTATDGNVVLLASLGGGGCTSGAGPQPGCFRMSLAKSAIPLGNHIFNNALHFPESALPTNPFGYTKPIRNLADKCFFLGVAFRPFDNGYSELRPTPPNWGKHPGRTMIVAFPFDEKSWCPPPGP